MTGSKYEFNVTMTCGGCSGAVTRVLTKLDGVEKFDVSLESQKVVVETKDAGPTYDKVLNVIGKTGKKINEGYEYVGEEKVTREVTLAA